jgi:hypothetical protein
MAIVGAAVVVAAAVGAAVVGAAGVGMGRTIDKRRGGGVRDGIGDGGVGAGYGGER